MKSFSFFVPAWRAALLFILTAAIVAGCGGGGGGGGGGATNGGGTTGGQVFATGQFIEFIGLNRSGGKIDPMNLHVGDQIQLTVVNYDGSGNRTVIPASGFTFDKNYAGITTTALGIMTVTSVPDTIMTLNVTVSVSGNPITVSAQAWVDTGDATSTITGKVTQTNGTTPLDYVQVIFYDNAKNVVGGALTMNGGNFVAQVSPAAHFATINGATLPISYYKTLLWNSHTYALSGTACLAQVSATSGQTTAMGNLRIPNELDGPPGPPDGCGP